MDHPTEDSMLAVQVRRGPITNEEGAAVGVRTGIGHRKDAFMRVRNPDLLISKLRAVDALRLSSIIIDDDLATLHHEARNNPLEDTSTVV